MQTNLLDFVAKNGNWYFENFGEALVYALIGFCIVFLGIVIIIAIIWLIGLLLRKTDNLAFLRNLGAKMRKKSANKHKVENIVTQTEGNTDDVPDEVKAAIIAAIMAYYSSQAPKCEFKVKRIKRI